MTDRVASTGVNRDAWVRFLGALLGLGLAFVSAVFSTVERIEGNMLASVALASLALILAAMVGITTVPYLAGRVAFRQLRETFDYQITREGIVYLAFTLVIGIAALNTGNNLLFIVVSAMLAAVVMSGVVSGAMLRAMQLEVVLPSQVFAMTTSLACIRLHNRRRWMACFSITVTPPNQKGGGLLRGRVTNAFLRRRTTSSNVHPVLTSPAYFPYLPAHGSATADVELRFERRGRYAQESFGLATRFPFSFFLKTRRVELARELIVYPAVDATDEMLEVLPMIRGEFESYLRGRGSDLYSIRDLAPEDSARHVDWKASAKTGELKVREFTREDERKLRIVFDNPAPGRLDSAAYERMVATAASLAWHFADEDTQLSFVAPGLENGTDVYGFLRYLALVEAFVGPDVVESLPASDDYNLIVTARPRGTVATSLWSTSYFVFME